LGEDHSNLVGALHDIVLELKFLSMPSSWHLQPPVSWIATATLLPESQLINLKSALEFPSSFAFSLHILEIIANL